MDNELRRIKAENKKARKSFIVVLVISMLVGGTAGAAIVFWEDDLASLPSIITGALTIISPYGIIVESVILLSLCLILYLKSKKIYSNWDGEAEEPISKVEILLSYALWLGSLNYILNFFFFATGLSLNCFHNEVTDWKEKVLVLLFSFIISSIFIVMEQQKIVDFEKLINPEKKGSIYDFKFAKKWEESCDEAQKLNIYMASYKAYQATNKTCILLFVILMLGNMIWDYGILPIAIVSIIWIVLLTSYCFEAIKQERMNKNKLGSVKM